MIEQIATKFSGEDAPNPKDVASAIATLIETPKGQRTARIVVGAPYGSDSLNEATEAVQAHVVDALGLGHLAQLKSA